MRACKHACIRNYITYIHIGTLHNTTIHKFRANKSDFFKKYDFSF